ncbi:MAG: hypothetical protein ACPGXK_13745 [Phycisphaerae bacterium]
MSARLIILLLAAGGLAVGFAMKVSAPATETHDDHDEQSEPPACSTPLSKFELPGDEPEQEPVFDIQVEVDHSTKKNRLIFNISELNGYYAESLRILFWYQSQPGMEPEESPLRLEHYMDKYVASNKILRECIELVPAEMRHIDHDIGQAENWAARVIHHNRARVTDPDILPERCGFSCGDDPSASTD